MKVLAALLFFYFGFLANAQNNLYQVPAAAVSFVDEAVQLSYRGNTLTYVAGLGWLNENLNDLPLLLEDKVYVSAEILAVLGLNLPRLRSVRSSSDSVIRLVMDIDNLPATDIKTLATEGSLTAQESLNLSLPPLLVPLHIPDLPQGIELELTTEAQSTRLTVSGPAMTYRVFALAEPTRLVIDLQPLATNIVEQTRQLRPGVLYKRFAVQTQRGPTGIHVLEFAPGQGDFRVVGEPTTPHTLSELASGGFAAINAGYFNTGTFEAIGLLRIDYALLSLPSRGRASIGFDAGEVVLDRVNAEVNVRINGQLFYANTQDSESRFNVYTAGGQIVGRPDQGVIVVNEGRVLENKIGPRRVPEDGFALVYGPEVRALALVDSDNFAALELKMAPETFQRARYAVEAGPLLISNGLPAYEPAREAFKEGTRIIDEATQQAAIGLKRDGTVIFLTADAMTARELIPVFLQLGATSAMRLDSGSSTTMYADGEVLNRRFERQIVSAIVYIPNEERAFKGQ